MNRFLIGLAASVLVCGSAYSHPHIKIWEPKIWEPNPPKITESSMPHRDWISGQTTANRIRGAVANPARRETVIVPRIKLLTSLLTGNK